jgi:hypothetical protein
MHCQLPKPQHHTPSNGSSITSLKLLFINRLTGVRFFQMEWPWNCSGEGELVKQLANRAKGHLEE